MKILMKISWINRDKFCKMLIEYHKILRQARTILNAIKMPNISGFNNPKNNNTNIILQICLKIVNKITGKTQDY